MAENAGSATGLPKSRRFTKILLLIFIVVAVLLVGLTAYVAYTLKAVSTAPPPPTPNALLTQSINVSLVSQDLIFTDNGTRQVPYALFKYDVHNLTTLTAAVVLLSNKPPTTFYLLNASNQCINCGDYAAFSNSLTLQFKHGLGTNSTLQIVSPGQVGSIASGSVLVIPNGRLPDFMLNTVDGTTLLESLLNRGVIVIYIGQDFSKLVSSQSVVVPDNNMPGFLSTSGYGSEGTASNLYFNSPTFFFTGGQPFGLLSYEKVGNGYIIAFSNYLNSWKNATDAARDVALAISEHFWISVEAQGVSTVTLPYAPSVKGNLGVFINVTKLPNVPPANISQLESSYGTATILGYAPSAPGRGLTSLPIGSIIIFTPSYQSNGTFALPSGAFPGQLLNATITLDIHSPQLVEPHIDIYTKDMQYVTSLPPFFSKNISAPYTFYPAFTMPVGTGSYIAQVNGFSGEHYASAYFTVPKLQLNLFHANYSNATFYFDAFALGRPVSNVTALVALNGQYPQNITITNGVFKYTLPPGVSTPQGNLTFSVLAFHTISLFRSVYSPTLVSINKQYIEFVIALVIVLLEVTLVKAPNRDEFYIDVSKLPGPAKTIIKLKYTDVLSTFDKLNLYYKWRYMPLSKSEVRSAISNNVRMYNMPVTLTYNNIELLLNGLLQGGYLIAADDLYAPISWVEQSKHDIEYLATFKKLRVYLVAHAHIFTDLDKSDTADIVTTLHNEKAYLVIYSKTSRFLSKLPVQSNIKTYLVFLNSDKLEEFKNSLYEVTSPENEQLKMYTSIGTVNLIDADNPEGILT